MPSSALITAFTLSESDVLGVSLGVFGWDQFDENKVSSRVMDYVAGNLSETGENSVFRTKLCEASLLEYMFATDNDGTGMLRQASAYMKRHLPEDVAKKMYQQYQDGKKAEADGKTEYSVEDADQAIINAKKEKEQADLAHSEKILCICLFHRICSTITM